MTQKDCIIVNDKTFPVDRRGDRVLIAGIEILKGDKMSESLELIYKRISDETGISNDTIFQAFARAALNIEKFPSVVEATNFYIKDVIEDIKVFAKAKEKSFGKFTKRESEITEYEMNDNNWK